MSIIEAIILGIIQGLTEFLPVSSSGHLELVKVILGGDSVPEESMLMIVDKFIGELNSLIVEKNILIKPTLKLKEYLLDNGWNPKMGARPLSRVINEKIKTPLAHKILFDQIHDAILEIDIDSNEELIFNSNTQHKVPDEVVSKEGYIVLDDFKPKNDEIL